ncbi:MAG: TfoX/Sxy family protein [Pseudomonadota bacterium]
MSSDGAPVSSIRNLGPASDAAFAKAGIHSAEALRALGPDKAYQRLLAAGAKPHFIGFYALVMGLQGRPWNDCQGDEKAALRARFDAIKAASAADGTHVSAIEAQLDALGLPDPTRNA